jgi:arylsulfatase A-like enzyme
MRAPFVRVLFVAMTALGGGIAACSRVEQQKTGPAPHSRTVELAADPAASQPGETVVRARWTVPDGLAPWTVEAGEHALLERELEDGTRVRALQLRGGKARLYLPGALEAGDFDQIEIELATQSACTLRAELVRGKRSVRSRQVELGGGQGTRTVTIPLLDASRKGPPFEGLRLDLGWHEREVELSRVSFVDRPLERWCDEGATEPGLVSVGDDRRLGMGLTVKRSLVADFEKHGAQRLVFAAAPVADACPRDAVPELVVRLRGAGGSTSETSTTFEPEEGAERAWQPLEISLAAFPDGPMQARFLLRGGGLVLVSELRVVAANVEPLTVLLVTADTYRGDHVGVSGSGIDVATPVIDALAARGLYFPRAQSTVTITIPSHAALMTGTHPRDTQLVSNRAALASEAPTLAEAFRASGWRTWAALSARHLLDPGNLGQGFERASAPSRPARDGGQTIEVLERWLADGGDEPLFVWLHLFDPHTPYAPPQRFLERQLAPLASSEAAAAGQETDLELAQGQARYRAEIDYTDSLLGRVLALPRFKGGIVALTGDHGESLGEHGIRFRHQEVYPDTLRVPLLLVWPGSPQGVRIETRLDHLGLGRTLLDLAGLQKAPFPGQSLLHWLDDAERATDTPVFAIAADGTTASITHGSWHLLLHLVAHPAENGRSFEEQEVELFDLAHDPACEKNLVEAEFETAKHLRAALVQWLTTGTPVGWMRRVELDEATRAQLAEMGYGAGDVAPDARWLDLDSEAPWAQRFR